MNVTFQYVPADFTSYSRSRIRQRLLRGVIAFTFIIAGMFVALGWSVTSASMVILAMEYAAFILVMVIMYTIFPWINRRQTYENELLQGPYSVEIDKDAVHVKSTLYEASYRWKSIRSIRSDRSNLYFVLPNLSAIIVPIRAFESKVDFNKFEHFSIFYWKGDEVPSCPIDPTSWPPPPNPR